MSARLSGARPPPAVLAAWAGTSLGLHWLWPLVFPPIRGLEPLTRLLVACAVMLVLWGLFELRRHGAAVDHGKATSTLVISGPFRFSRNPIYVGLVALMLAVSLDRGSVWALLMVPVAVFALQRLTIEREESYLHDLFGTDYDQYRARVRPWL